MSTVAVRLHRIHQTPLERPRAHRVDERVGDGTQQRRELDEHQREDGILPNAMAEADAQKREEQRTFEDHEEDGDRHQHLRQ